MSGAADGARAAVPRVRVPAVAIAALVLLVLGVLSLAPAISTALSQQRAIADAEARIAAHQAVNLSGSQPFAVFGVAHKPDVFWGTGISLGIQTGAGTADERRGFVA